jgi:hypothetical protein
MANEKLTEEQLRAIQAMGASFSTLGIPLATILPFQNLLENNQLSKIKQQEAMRMFPQADPNLFDYKRGGTLPNKNANETIPLTERTASSRVFDKEIGRKNTLNPNAIYRGQSSLPEYLTGVPGAPSPELGSFSQAIGNKALFPEGDIQAITVTPGPNPGRFAKDYAEILADKLGKTINEREAFLNRGLSSNLPDYDSPVSTTDPFGTAAIEKNFETINKINKKINVLSSKVPGTAGYVWGNTEYPQYSYAEGNWGLGQKLAGENPSLYLSRINADPTKETNYLYTGNVLTQGDISSVEPRVRFKQHEDLGLGTGPSWGVAPNKDISFRKDLIGARGELTTGDLQALLAERKLPFEYQVQGRSGPTKKPGQVLRANLEALASAENISPSQAAEKYARLIPSVGEPSVPPTAAVFARAGEFPVQGQMASPFGQFAAKTDLRQVGILPPADKAQYSPFTVDEFDTTFKYIYPRYNASTIKEIDPNARIIETMLSKGAEEAQKEFVQNINNPSSDLIINRDALRPQAANKLLDRTVKNLIEESKPIQGLGIGGLATGAVATAMDPGVIDALSRGDYQQAGTTAALNTAIGSATGGATAKGLQALQAAGYARPAAAIGSALPLVGGVLGGLSAIETGKALNRAYRAQTGKDWVTRNQPASATPAYTLGPTQLLGATPTVKPRMGKAILNGQLIDVPYGSVAGTKTVGRPWWDQAGSRLQKFADLLNRGSIFGR